LYSRVRLVTAASLIAFGILIGIGVLALLPSAGEQPLVAIANVSSRAAMPWIGGSKPNAAPKAVEPANPATVEAMPAAGNPAESLLKPSRIATAAPQEFVPPKPASVIPAREEAPQQTPAPQVAAPQKPVQPELPRQSSLTAPVQETPVQRPAAIAPRAAVQPPAVKERHVARPAAEAPADVAAPKKTARRDRPAKRPTNEALNTVRKFGDNLQDIPVNSYAADGTPKRIVIRPTSIQDVYYYSAPR
jgi:hypothetical protein